MIRKIEAPSEKQLSCSAALLRWACAEHGHICFGQLEFICYLPFNTVLQSFILNLVFSFL
jgi:hypothetical protein